ncbi:winged helix-turn-helix transcriptional regulator [Actinocrispum wychmicini]|uniref:HxlR family transcriptional regulator n=1 Tax=Actinocrispum wychmicini TaxID=1213861 RepID=A0A4R2J7C1_9PSEU|nr:helix-turn-helix domain-containing protein [Actinocrispum wychmicini]TCO54993.1 HxlR family transcriptional regulator [Actinocrispum wychmicini]
MKASELMGWDASTPVGDVYNSECPGQMIVEHVTSRWAPLIVTALLDGQLRFFELRDKIGGITEKVLSQKLRTLVRDGLIERTVEPSTPPKVSYALSDLGESLAQHLTGLFGWIVANGSAILAAQQEHDATQR